jgi:hypothetical protein
MKTVSGKVTIIWAVDLPDKFQHEKNVPAKDPAIQAVLDFIPQKGDVWCFGDARQPAKVYLEIHEDDFEIEEDSRDEKE